MSIEIHCNVRLPLRCRRRRSARQSRRSVTFLEKNDMHPIFNINSAEFQLVAESKKVELWPFVSWIGIKT